MNRIQQKTQNIEPKHVRTAFLDDSDVLLVARIGAFVFGFVRRPWRRNRYDNSVWGPRSGAGT
jgi:hypothetical protein